MKIQEFIEKYKKANGMQSVKSMLATKNYLPFAEKQELVDRVLNKCINDNNGYMQFDEMEKYLSFTMEIIMAYTNIEFDKDFNTAIHEYDALCEAGILNNIIDTFEGEYKTVLDMVGMRQDYIMRSNSIEAQVAKFLNSLNDKLDVLTNIAAEQMASFGFDNLGITAGDITQLTEFVKTLGK